MMCGVGPGFPGSVPPRVLLPAGSGSVRADLAPLMSPPATLRTSVWTPWTRACSCPPERSGECGRIPTAFRLAFELPPVGRVEVGTSGVAHVRELLAAIGLDVEGARISRDRALLRARADRDCGAASACP